MAPQPIQYTTLDVFTTERYRGNQLGVVSVPESLKLSQSDKLKIAQEFNYSESIFVHEPDSTPTPTSDDDSQPPPPQVTVDIFTPVSELPFAGHPTIGAIYHILTTHFPTRDTITLNLKAGQVHGKLDRTTGFASATVPQEYHAHQSRIPWERILTAQPSLATHSHAHTRVHDDSAMVSIVRGMNFVLVDLTATPELLEHIRATNTDPGAPSDLDAEWPPTLMGTVYFVVRQTDPDHNDDDGVIRVEQRMVAIGLEDPATGSASCALSCHLALRRAQQERFDAGPEWVGEVEGDAGKKRTYQIDIVQGRHMGRRSEISCTVTLDRSGRVVEEVVLAGPSRDVMRGELIWDQN